MSVNLGVAGVSDVADVSREGRGGGNPIVAERINPGGGVPVSHGLE